MEGKTRKVRKLALFTAAFMAAVFLFTGQPHKASAQPIVSPNGVGDLLIFQLWTTQGGTDTLVAIVNPFGGQASRFVHVRFHEQVASVDVRNFTICLSPGDVWTAAISTTVAGTSSNLVVGNAGSCDAAVAGAGFTPPPLVGVGVPIAAATGYMEAFTMEAGGGDDTLWGVATPVNITSAFSSSINAVSFSGWNAISESANVTSTTGNGTVGNTGSGTSLSQALAREGGIDKEVLQARYVAGGVAAATTQIVLTFPAGFQPGAADPVTAFFFDEAENINFSPRQIILPWEVNVCTIANDGTVTNITCPGAGNSFDVIGSAGAFTEGWVRIINNAVGVETDGLDDLPVSRFAAASLVLSSFTGSGGTFFDQSFPITWSSILGAGNVTQAAANGLQCSTTNQTGCLSFSVASTFFPWTSAAAFSTAGQGLFILGGGQFTSLSGLAQDEINTTGGLIRTGTVVP